MEKFKSMIVELRQFELFQRDQQLRKKGKNMLKTKQPLIKDRSVSASLSHSQKSEGKSGDFSDNQIDTSEMQEWTDEDWASSKKGLFYRPNIASKS